MDSSSRTALDRHRARTEEIPRPATFDGKTADTSYWIGSVYAYISLNNHIYDNDNKKVMFALSFCREGGSSTRTCIEVRLVAFVAIEASVCGASIIVPRVLPRDVDTHVSD